MKSCGFLRCAGRRGRVRTAMGQVDAKPMKCRRPRVRRAGGGTGYPVRPGDDGVQCRVNGSSTDDRSDSRKPIRVAKRSALARWGGRPATRRGLRGECAGWHDACQPDVVRIPARGHGDAEPSGRCRALGQGGERRRDHGVCPAHRCSLRLSCATGCNRLQSGATTRLSLRREAAPDTNWSAFGDIAVMRFVVARSRRAPAAGASPSRVSWRR